MHTPLLSSPKGTKLAKRTAAGVTPRQPSTLVATGGLGLGRERGLARIKRRQRICWLKCRGIVAGANVAGAMNYARRKKLGMSNEPSINSRARQGICNRR
jgi:hypothetical protein